MFLIEPEQTPYDLRFRLWDIPVRIHPTFWIFSAVLGWPGQLPEGSRHLMIPIVLTWIACAFVSILIHELGHVLAGRLFGQRGQIVLYSFGGLAIGSAGLASRWKRIFVTFAGPLAGFLFLGAIFAVIFALRIDTDSLPRMARIALGDLFWINLVWGILNLLPIWPLDGGHISRDLLDGLLPDRGARIAMGFSLVVAGGLAAHALGVEYGRPLIPLPYIEKMGGVWMVFFFGLLAVSSFQALQAMERERRWHDDHWDR